VGAQIKLAPSSIRLKNEDVAYSRSALARLVGLPSPMTTDERNMWAINFDFGTSRTLFGAVTGDKRGLEISVLVPVGEKHFNFTHKLFGFFLNLYEKLFCQVQKKEKTILR
jgi:hypothetical protein